MRQSRLLSDKEGKLKEITLIMLENEKDLETGRTIMIPVEGTEMTVPAYSKRHTLGAVSGRLGYSSGKGRSKSGR